MERMKREIRRISRSHSGEDLFCEVLNRLS